MLRQGATPLAAAAAGSASTTALTLAASASAISLAAATTAVLDLERLRPRRLPAGGELIRDAEGL